MSFDGNNLKEGGTKENKNNSSICSSDSMSHSSDEKGSDKGSVSSSSDTSESCFSENHYQNKTIRYLKEGSIFGEVALLTKLKRTATVQSEGNCTCAFLCQDDVETLKENFPHIVKEFLQKILKDYND